jgi:cytohesin
MNVTIHIVISEVRMKNLSKCFFAIFAIIFISACQPRKPETEIASAVQQNNADAVREYLVALGDPNALSRFKDPLLYLAAGRQGGLEVTRILIDAGADVNAQGKNGITILTSAASWCNVEEIRLLLQAGADVNLAGKNKKTPLKSICQTPEKRRAVTFDILIKAGAVRP